MKSKLRITPNGKLRHGTPPIYIKVDGVVVGKVLDGPQAGEIIYIKLDQLKMVP